MTLSDSELMERYRDGDEEAFGQLVNRFQRPLINFFFRLTWDRFLSEDYAQEVFARLVRYRGSYRRTAKFTTYMFRIAKNYWIDRYRENKGSPDVASLDAPMGGDGGRALHLRDTVAADGPTPEQVVRNEEIRTRIKAAVARLPSEQRLVFVLAENQGLKYTDIAEVMEIPVGTVKSRMHAAMRRLRELLKDVIDGS
jgi:RNA polymerase sigma-70 factor (ECF subfamily)